MNVLSTIRQPKTTHTMPNEPDNSNDSTNPFTGLPPGSQLNPDDITDEQLEAIAPFLIGRFEADYSAFLERVRDDATVAASMDDEEMRRVMQTVKGYEAQLASWIERLGDRATDRLKELLRQFGKVADSIAAALNSPLPEQDDDPGEAWKDKPE